MAIAKEGIGGFIGLWYGKDKRRIYHLYLGLIPVSDAIKHS